ncbi:NAD(P)H-dependent oxidoreductase [Chloroflexota bacterium]
MNLYSLLQQREKTDRPIKIGAIGAGKFCTMFLAQLQFTPGMRMIGIADLVPEKARQAWLRAGWSEERLSLCNSTTAINDSARQGKTALTDDAYKLIQADLDVILEVTGIPEAGAYHAWNALEAGKHVVMVSVEADALLGVALKKKADEKKLVYSMAYGDQPALICEEIDWARASGFEVVCAGKGTGYQPEYHYSTPQTVWKYYGFSEEQVESGDYNPQMYNSFVDGTKSAIEMCAVANASGLVPQKCGLQFPPVEVDELPEILKPKSAGGILEHSATVEVIANAYRDRTPIQRNLRFGTYVVFKAPTDYVKRCFSEYGVLRDSSGEYAALYRPNHLIGLELGISVASAVIRGEPTGSAQSFVADVASVAKGDMKPKDVLDGEGGYTVFGRLVQAEESIRGKYFPIGLSAGAKVIRPLVKNAILTYDDVEVDTSLFSYELRKSMEEEVKDRGPSS